MPKTDDPLKSANDLKSQLNVWENRLAYTKSENEKLIKANETLHKEIDTTRELISQEVSKKQAEIRSEGSKIYEERKKLEADKLELEKALVSLKQERNVIERMKTDNFELRKTLEESQGKIGQFIRIVQEAAAKL